MGLSDICIRRPVFATVLSLVVVLVGLVVLQPPAGARVSEHRSAGGLVQTDLSRRERGGDREPGHALLEESLAGIEGIDFMRSTTRQEAARSPSASSSAAIRRRRQRCARPRRPRARPSAGRDRRADHLQGRGRRAADHLSRVLLRPPSPLEITDFADRFVKDRLQALTGVAEARIFGERRYAMRDLARSPRGSPPTA